MITILFFILVILAIVGAIYPALPSVIFSFFSALCLYFLPGSNFTLTYLLIFAIVCIVIYCLDYAIPLFTTKLIGGTKAGVRGAAIGMFFAIFIPFTPFAILFGGIWSVVILPLLAAFIAEIIQEPNNLATAFRSALGSFIGFLLSVGLKIALAISLLFFYF